MKRARKEIHLNRLHIIHRFFLSRFCHILDHMLDEEVDEIDALLVGKFGRLGIRLHGRLLQIADSVSSEEPFSA